jgi:hypothetical protein
MSDRSKVILVVLGIVLIIIHDAIHGGSLGLF